MCDVQRRIVVVQGFADIAQAKAMVDGVDFAGGKIRTVLKGRSVGDFTVKGFGFFHQKKVDTFFGLRRQTVAGFDGVVKRIAKDDTEVARGDGQRLLNAYLSGKGDVFAHRQRLLGVENGIQRIVAGVNGWRGCLERIGQISEVALAALNVASI